MDQRPLPLPGGQPVKVVVRLVAQPGMQYEVCREKVEWPEGWPIPREHEEVNLPGLPESLTGGINTWHVRHVIWYPQGDPNSDDPEPFIYLVLGSRRPQ